MNPTLHLPDCLPKGDGNLAFVSQTVQTWQAPRPLGRRHAHASSFSEQGEICSWESALGSVVHLPPPSRSLPSSTNVDERRQAVLTPFHFLLRSSSIPCTGGVSQSPWPDSYDSTIRPAPGPAPRPTGPVADQLPKRGEPARSSSHPAPPFRRHSDRNH